MSTTRPRFGVVVADIMRDPNLSTTAKVVYAVLCTYADSDRECWPSNETLGQALGLSVPTIKRAISELIGAKVIEREDRYRTDGGRATSITRLIDVNRGGVTAEPPPLFITGPDPRVTSEPQNNTSKNNTSKNTSPSNPDGFDEWWGLYPKKTGKQDACKAYRSAIKTTPPATILSGLRSHLAVLRDQKQRGYCPDPATWLRAGRWEDEVPASTTEAAAPRITGKAFR